MATLGPRARKALKILVSAVQSRPCPPLPFRPVGHFPAAEFQRRTLGTLDLHRTCPVRIESRRENGAAPPRRIPCACSSPRASRCRAADHLSGTLAEPQHEL